MLKVNDIRNLIIEKYKNKEFVTDKTGVKTIELIGQSFIADEETIFGEVNTDYINRELEWYLSESLYVKDIPGGPPKIWEQVASRDGKINSNYGWCVFSNHNGNQFDRVLDHFMYNVDTRRATMIYTRPSMHVDYNKDGMSDFVCTNAVNYFIRDNKLHCVVQMRSNDIVFGFRNDLAWHKWVLGYLTNKLNVAKYSYLEQGDIIWNAASLHMYERHFNLLG